jgi:hypothetical protein
MTPAVRRVVLAWAAILVAFLASPRGSLAQPAPASSAPSPSESVAPPSPELAPPPPSPAAALLAVPSLAASASALAPAGSPPPETPATPRPVGPPLSAATAFALSLGGTLGSWTMVGLGLRDGVRANVPQVWVAGLIGAVLAPSFGHWYRGKILTRGLRVRVAGAALGGLAVGRAITCEDGCTGTMEAVMAFGGFALYIVGTAHDIFTAPIEVQKHNQRIELLGLAPVVSSQSAGVALAGRF